jgi:hypothetical protein
MGGDVFEHFSPKKQGGFYSSPPFFLSLDFGRGIDSQRGKKTTIIFDWNK